MQSRKSILEEKLYEVENLKRQLANFDLIINKENVSPEKMVEKEKVRLRDIYMDFEEMNQEMSISKLSTSSNMSYIQETSSKILKVFGRLMKGKKSSQTGPILSTEFLQEINTKQP